MTRWTLVVILLLPALARAETWRWTDGSGQVHYSNVPGHVPARAREVRGRVGYLGATLEELAEQGETGGEEAAASASLDRVRAERRIRRRLAEIEAFHEQVRARQRARLQAYSNSTLLPDWMVADRWMALESEAAKLRAELERLEDAGRPAS